MQNKNQSPRMRESLQCNQNNGYVGNEEVKKRNIKLFMGQIPSTMKERDIQLELSKYCQIDHVVVLRDVETKKHKRIMRIYFPLFPRLCFYLCSF